jgi:hypothetical protein
VLPAVEEGRVYEALLKFKGTGKAVINGTDILISINPVDNHFLDSPDFLLWVQVSFRVFGEELKLTVPVPIEAEKGGLYGGALEDLEKFVQRQKHTIELPMLVIAESGFDEKEKSESFPVKFSLKQIPVRLIEDSTAGTK